MRTGTYLIRRLLWAVVTLIGITVVTFLMTRLAPGDPATARLSDSAAARMTPAEHARLRAYLQLDRPMVEQYGRWLWRAVRLDFGASWSSGRSVSERILERAGASVILLIASLALSLAVAVPIGLYSAARAGERFDRWSGVVLAGLFALPAYAAALVLLDVFAVRLDWFPVSGRRSLDYQSLSSGQRLLDAGKHAVLITLCFTYPWATYQARFVRHTVLEIVGAPFVTTARAKGVSELRVYTRHVLRNVLIGLLTLLGALLPAVVSGSVVLEHVFGWPGLGGLYVEGLFARDFPLVMGLTVLTAVTVLAGNLVVDLAYGLVDPRVRHG